MSEKGSKDEYETEGKSDAKFAFCISTIKNVHKRALIQNIFPRIKSPRSYRTLWPITLKYDGISPQVEISQILAGIGKKQNCA